ncbi:enoyl-CoA hydratase/isomerase family protein [Nocardioides sp. AN3]
MTAALPIGEDVCLLQVDGPVATVTLNRPAAKNALNLPLLHALADQLRQCLEAEVSVLVLRAEGTAFCAGADLRSDDGTAIGQPGLRRRLIEEVLGLVASFPVAIAVVQGPAVGGGWGLAFAADVVLAAEDAVFRFPELALGFVPPAPIVARFGEVAGPVRSLRLLGSGESFSATDPALAGLVETLAADALPGRARQLAELFAGSAPGLLRVLKDSISTAPVVERHDHE